ncbi:MAG: GNAT family N-acetyltransferase [Muribaculaceae bacterium]|nr:GNAT family N-acetyltransferase [Muribaculaceae bacterium]
MTITLRALEPEDADLMYRAENELTATLQSDSPAPYSRRMLVEYAMTYDADPFRSGQLRLIAVDQENTPVGILDYYDISARDSHAWVSCLVLPEYRGQNIGKEMIAAGVGYAVNRLGLTSLAAIVHTDNIPSLRVFGYAGFQKIGILEKWHFSNGTLRDVALLQYHI